MSIKILRLIGTLEGISFLLLLLFAMRMKYFYDQPFWVKYIGMGHGVLFLLFILALFIVCQLKKWSVTVFVLGILAAILPFGPFIFDLKLKKLNG